MQKNEIRTLTEQILGGMTIKVETIDGTPTLSPTVTEQEDRIVYAYSGAGISAQIDAIADENSVRLELNLTSKASLVPDAVIFPFHIEFADENLVSYHDGNNWWMINAFPKTIAEMPKRAQSFLMHKGDLHYSLVPLCGDIFYTEADEKGLHVRIGCGGYHELHGPMLTMAIADHAIKAVEINYAAAVQNGSIKVPLRKDRKYPEVFEKFGWCSWNAFYADVSSEKLFKKLDEFKAKNIPIRWVIIDDGWENTKDGKLVGFEANPEKFPEGLAACIARMKKEYGIEQVGVWHAFQAYWEGIHPDSPLVEKFNDSLMHVRQGFKVLPCNDPEKAFVFWDAMHTYLADSGVDFVKVDNQSSSCETFEGSVSTAMAARNTHISLEKSVNLHFGGDIINCMGMDMINAMQRPGTAVSRNSDDFFPDKENGFAKHLRQNAYNAIWHSQLQHCDYDMWWTGTSAPVQSGVLRAISGGPVYISDKLDISCREHVIPVVGEDGTICRLDDAAMPTDDCIYLDFEAEKKLFKVFNHKDDAAALAVFNVAHEELSESFELKNIPALDENTRYVLYEYFTRTYQVVTKADTIALKVAADDVASYSFFPIHGTGDSAYIEEGDTTRYVSCCKKTGKKVLVKDLIG